MFNYIKYLKLMDNYSEEKLNSKIGCSWYGNTILLVIGSFLLSEFLFSLLYFRSYILFSILYIILLSSTFIYVLTRKAGIGLSNNRIFYVKFRHFGVKIKKIEEISFENVRYIKIFNILGIYLISISFLSSRGELEKIKIYFSKKYVGLGAEEIMRNRKDIIDKLMAMEKKLDRGDF